MSSQLRVDKILPVDGAPTDGGGGIIQVVQTIKKDQFTTSNNTSNYTDLTGLSATTTLGTPTAFNETGWGADTWGAEGWGGAVSLIDLTGLSLTASVNLPTNNVVVKPGWGTLTWGQNGWGSVDSAVFNITGLSATTSLGTLGDIPEQQLTLTGQSADIDFGTLGIKGDAAFTLAALSQIISSPGLLSSER